MLKTIKDICKLAFLIVAVVLVFGAGHLYQDYVWSQIFNLFK